MNHNQAPSSANQNVEDFTAWEAELPDMSNIIEAYEGETSQEVETNPDQLRDAQADRVGDLATQYAAESGRQMPEASTENSDSDEQRIGYGSRSSRGIVKVADGINKLTGGLDSLANTIDDRGGLRKIGKRILGRIGRSAQNHLIKGAKAMGDRIDSAFDWSADKTKDIKVTVAQKAEKAQENWEDRRAEKQAYKMNRQMDKEAQAAETTEVDESASTEELYDPFASGDRENDEFLNDLHDQIDRENDARNAAEAEKVAQHDAAVRKRAANIAKIRRRQNIEAVVGKGIDRIKTGKDKVVKIGRATARFARGAKAYAAGVHAAGMESVRADAAIRNEKQSDYDLTA